MFWVHCAFGIVYNRGLEQQQEENNHIDKHNHDGDAGEKEDEEDKAVGPIPSYPDGTSVLAAVGSPCWRVHLPRDLHPNVYSI